MARLDGKVVKADGELFFVPKEVYLELRRARYLSQDHYRIAKDFAREMSYYPIVYETGCGHLEPGDGPVDIDLDWTECQRSRWATGGPVDQSKRRSVTYGHINSVVNSAASLESNRLQVLEQQERNL